MYFSKSKKMYCAFIDYEKAFPSVWRTGLWLKLLGYGVDGKFFRVVYNMYKDIKSCVCVNNEYSDYFVSYSGVRQGENLSPLLFAMFVNDLEECIWQKGISPIELSEADLGCYIKLSVIMYADDTVLISDSSEGLQNGLDALYDYCQDWKLKVNESKTKVMIFCKRVTKDMKLLQFTLNKTKVDIVKSYKYLGVLFTPNGRFKETIKYLCDQAQKAMFCLLKKARSLRLPIDVQLHLFRSTVLPVALYGCEIWGFEDCSIVKRLHLKFCKYILRIKSSTPTFMVYGELGEYPVDIDIKCRMLGFWLKLINGKQTKYSCILYHILLYRFNAGLIKSDWISSVKRILVDSGFNNVWMYPTIFESKWVTNAVKLRLRDQFLQSWYENVRISEKGINYRLYKKDFTFESYLNVLPFPLWNHVLKFRICNLRLPIELGRFTNLPRHERTCHICNLDKLGDEFHFMFECTDDRMVILRNKFINPEYTINCNTIKFDKLMNCTDLPTLIGLAKYIREGMKVFK